MVAETSMMGILVFRDLELVFVDNYDKKRNLRIHNVKDTEVWEYQH